MTASQIHTCHRGPFPVLIEEIEDEDTDPCEGVRNLEEEVQNTTESVPVNFMPSDPEDMPKFCQFTGDDNKEIEDGNCIFCVTIHDQDKHHNVRAMSTVSQ